MRLQGFVRRGPLAGVAVVALAVLAGCGASKPAARVSPSARARSLLRQTVAAQHRVRSGVLAATLAVTPASPAAANPISISLEGPFRNGGERRLPAADFVNPRVVGSDRIGGVATTRIHAGVDAKTLFADPSTLLPEVSSLARSGSIGQLFRGLPASTQRRISREPRDPSVDLWIGSSDRILRKLVLSFDIPAGARVAGKVGGGPHVVTLTLQYSDVNRPRTIAAPTTPHPYTAFEAKFDAIAQQLGLGATSPTPTSTAREIDTTPHKTRPNRAPELTLSPYAQCIANAEGDVTKEQKCATLSNGASKPIH